MFVWLCAFRFLPLIAALGTGFLLSLSVFLSGVFYTNHSDGVSHLSAGAANWSCCDPFRQEHPVWLHSSPFPCELFLQWLCLARQRVYGIILIPTWSNNAQQWVVTKHMRWVNKQTENVQSERDWCVIFCMSPNWAENRYRLQTVAPSWRPVCPEVDLKIQDTVIGHWKIY